MLGGNITGIKKIKVVYTIVISIKHTYDAGIFKQSMGARNRVGKGLSTGPPEPVFVNV